MTKKKFLLRMAGTNANGQLIQSDKTVFGEQKEIDDAAWKITQKWIKRGYTNIHVVGIAEVVKVRGNPLHN